jgi:thioredoxin 1
MPTFLVFKSGAVADTLRGADASALRAAVARAAAGAAAGPSAAFASGRGYRLGNAGEPSVPIRNHRSGGAGGVDAALAGAAALGGAAGVAVRFVALYLTTLFSFDAFVAAEASPFAVRREADKKNR